MSFLRGNFRGLNSNVASSKRVDPEMSLGFAGFKGQGVSYSIWGLRTPNDIKAVDHSYQVSPRNRKRFITDPRSYWDFRDGDQNC